MNEVLKSNFEKLSLNAALLNSKKFFKLQENQIHNWLFYLKFIIIIS